MAHAHKSGTVRVEALKVAAKAEDGRETTIVHEVGFEIARGEVLALIGESGSGKTTIALAMMGYARKGCAIRGGSVDVFGTQVLASSPAELRALRGNRIAYIAQSAAASFNPARTIMAQVIESALIHGSLTAEAATAKAKTLFRELALPNPDTIGDRYPHQVSGGQLQRLLAAMALLNDPDLVIFDEPTTALDVTTQIEVLVSFKAAIRERGITGIYVSHDLAVVAQIADRIAVLRHGRLAEIGAVDQMVSAPAHPYTRQLIAAASPVKRKGAEASPQTGEPRSSRRPASPPATVRSGPTACRRSRSCTMSASRCAAARPSGSSANRARARARWRASSPASCRPPAARYGSTARFWPRRSASATARPCGGSRSSSRTPTRC